MVMIVAPAEQDVAALKPSIKSLLAPSEIARWEDAAGLSLPDSNFSERIGYTIVRFLIASIGSSHRARPEDRKILQEQLRRHRAMTRALATALRRYGPEPPCDVEWARRRSAAREVLLEQAIAQIEKLPRGKPPYRAFERFICDVAEAYGSATGKRLVVKLNAATEQFSGPLAALVEAAFASAKSAWRESGFKSRLAAPKRRNARLEYARRVVQSLAVNRR